MIGYLHGTVLDSCLNPTIIVCHGIGYEVHISERQSSHIKGGNEVKLFIKQIVRDNAIELFGFLDMAEKNIFNLLCKVPKIGPRTAMSVLNVYTSDQIIGAIVHADSAMLTRVPGIGKKTAERVLVELRDLAADFTLAQVNVSTEANVVHDAIEALIALGYNRAQADSDVRQAVQSLPEAGVDTIIRKVLQGV